MKSKYLAFGLSALLVLSLVSCGGQQAQEPQEPKQEVQQAEPISAQPVVAPEEVKQEIMPTASETVPEELSGEALTHYFKLAYDGSKAYVSGLSTEEAIDWELDVLGIRAQNENQSLPDDYRDQYRAWRPVDEAPPVETSTTQQTQQVSDATKNQNKTQNQNQTTQQQQQNQTQGTTQQAKPSSSSDAYDPYDGYGSYNAYIDAKCQKFPEYSREEIISMFPDEATSYVDQAGAAANREQNRLTSG